jgi:hypothetical protein
MDTKTRYQIECQEGCPTGTLHEATYDHTNESGQRVFIAVCDGYEDQYTEEVVIEVIETEQRLDLDLTPQQPTVENRDGSIYLDGERIGFITESFHVRTKTIKYRPHFVVDGVKVGEVGPQRTKETAIQCILAAHAIR